MELKYNFGIDDWVEFQKHHLKNSKSFKKRRWIVMLTVPIVFAILTLLDYIADEFNLISVITFGVFSIIWISIGSKVLTNRTLRVLKRNLIKSDTSNIFGEHILILNEQGLSLTQPGSESKVKWEKLIRLEESNDYYYLYHTAITAFVIPKNNNKVNLNELDKFLRSKITSHK